MSIIQQKIDAWQWILQSLKMYVSFYLWTKQKIILLWGLNKSEIEKYFKEVLYTTIRCTYSFWPWFALTGHSQLWDYTDLDTTLARKVFTSTQNQMYQYASDTSRNLLQSCLVFHLILDLLLKTSFWANFY